MNGETLEVLDETSRWHARAVSYWAGRWEQLAAQLPQFETEEFRVTGGAPPNPYMKTVIRLPRNLFEQPIPIGVVSNTYTLAQHSDVAQKCFDGIRKAGIDPAHLRCELGLTELGEWMNLRIYFPEDQGYIPNDKQKLALRLECFNSVDASSRLVILLGWFRFVCSNGMVIGETKAELRDIHNKHMDLQRIPQIVYNGLQKVQGDVDRLQSWEKLCIPPDRLKSWINTTVAEQWGKRAACRIYHICQAGYDVTLIGPFSPGDAAEKPVKQAQQVPGAASPARSLYDVSQALSWVATGRANAEERLAWQADIPKLLQELQASLS